MQLLAVGDVPVLNLRHAMELAEACDGCLDPLVAKITSWCTKGHIWKRSFLSSIDIFGVNVKFWFEDWNGHLIIQMLSLVKFHVNINIVVYIICIPVFNFQYIYMIYIYIYMYMYDTYIYTRTHFILFTNPSPNSICRPYLRFNLQQNQVLILRSAEARKATAEVLQK